MKRFMRFYEKLMNAIALFSAVLLVLIVLVICIQTFFRYVIVYSLPWSEELSRYAFIMLMGWGLCVAISKEGLLRIDLIDAWIGKNRRAENIMQVLYALMGVVVCAVLVFNMPALVKIGSFSASPSMHIKMSHIYIFLGCGFGMSLFASVVVLIRRLLILFAKDAVEKGGEE